MSQADGRLASPNAQPDDNNEISERIPMSAFHMALAAVTLPDAHCGSPPGSRPLFLKTWVGPSLPLHF